MCIEEMGFTPDQCVMVGDSDNDAIGAEGIGCPFIGVTYGFGFEKPEDVMEFKNIGVAASPDEIYDIITRL
jgi:phosphoglycolate phosphatase